MAFPWGGSLTYTQMAEKFGKSAAFRYYQLRQEREVVMIPAPARR